MGGFFGVASVRDCVRDVYYGTDYHSHLGTVRGGLASQGPDGIVRFIHDISNTPFRSKFEDDLPRLRGNTGVGVISDTDDQPVVIRSHLGTYALVTVAKVTNVEELAAESFRSKTAHFAEVRGGQINPTELVAALINREATFVDGIRHALSRVEGSCSLLLMTGDGIYAARDRLGRTPVALGSKDGARAVASETCAFPNLGYEVDRYLGPGEIVHLSPDGCETKQAPGERMQICAFLWIYYGYPASSYEGINVEAARNRCGAALGRKDDAKIDMVCGIPDSGIGHAIGYASERGIPYRRPFVKYTPTWPRSFMPQDQTVRDEVARMKLIPIGELVRGSRMLFCEDSIVRGTQLQDTIRLLFEAGAREVHMRPACPPLVCACKFLNFSRSKSELDLAGRKAITELEPGNTPEIAEYAQAGSPPYRAMVERVRRRLGLTTLKYQELGDMVEAIGLPKDKLCTYCWTGTVPGE
ncbi:MAG: amidophosphoribosyltransferase [Planctomycetota bacterium]|jgi:amidophosphoribosyltransferase